MILKEGFITENHNDNQEIVVPNLDIFLQNNILNLDIPKRKENVDLLKNSKNKEIIGDYVIVNDFTLTTEGSRIVLSYKNNNDKIFVVKVVGEKFMENLTYLNNWGDMTVEEYLMNQGFDNPNVLLPTEIIKKEGKVYRFYEAMDMDLEKYLETHKQLNIKEAISIILRACRGVESLNENNIFNVDFAPLNIMLTNNSLKLIDLDGASIDKEKNGVLVRNYLGNNRFTAAPELFEERPVFDKTVDVYAASSNLYRLIIGNWPYDIEKKTRELDLSYEEKMNAFKNEHLSGNIIFPENTPLRLREIIKKGMNPVPKNRYQTMVEFMDDLVNFINKENI